MHGRGQWRPARLSAMKMVSGSTVNGRPTVSDAMLIDVSNAPVLSKQ
jgi:hypothetical protein